MNAVIYARYSSHGQTEQSIEGQMRDCHAFALREGYAVIGEYIDRALSGRTDDRPDFQRMIADSSKKQFDIVIVWKLDRFARNRYDSAIYKNKLRKHDVKVISATENISDNPEGIILEGLLESMAEYYSANLSKHVRRGMREGAIAGTYLGGHVPFGFKVENKRLVADAETADIARFIFTEYAAGTSKKDIISSINAKGFRNKAGKPYSASGFQTLLRSKKYIGVYTHNGMDVTGGCEAIIDEHTFMQVQRRLSAAKRAPAAAKAKTRYLLQGKVFCGICGSPMVGESGRGKSGVVYNYYSCASRKKHRTCKKKNERKGFLEWYVVEQTVKYVLTPQRIKYIASRVVEEYDKEFDYSKLKSMEQRIVSINKDISTAVDASLKAPDSVRQVYYDKIEALQAQRADIETDLSRFRIACDIRYTPEQIEAWLKSFCNGDPLDETFQQRVIDTFVTSFFVYDDKVLIYYNVKDGKQISYIEMQASLAESESVRISTPPPRQIASNPNFPEFVFISGVFGIVCKR